MAAPAFPPFRLRFATAATLLGMLGLAGCQTGGYQDSVPRPAACSRSKAWHRMFRYGAMPWARR